MKLTDYAQRAAPMDYYLNMSLKKDLYGIEIGVDVGAHAESLLLNCQVGFLVLVDVWDKEFYRGYCKGRLSTKGLDALYEMLQTTSLKAAESFGIECFDFIYIDQKHDYDSVKADLQAWWPKLKPGGIMGYRNYAESNKGLKQAIDEFISEKCLSKYDIVQSEIVLFK